MHIFRTPASTKNCGLFSFAIPLIAILVSMMLVLVPAAGTYWNLRNVARGISSSGASAPRILIGSGTFRMLLSVEQIPRYSLNSAAMLQEGTITLLNAPGYLLYSLIATSTGHSALWSPGWMWSGLWLVIMMPLCALPAWWLVGRGLDGWFLRRRLRLGDMIVSLVLLLGSATISAGLRFGLTPQERSGDEKLAWLIAGFAWWAGLFAISFGVWVYQRTTHNKWRGNESG